MVRTLAADVAALARGRQNDGGPIVSPELQIVVTFAFFLVLLTCGMAVPFAIAVPAMFYLLLQGGLPSLNSLGLVSWGSMNSFVLTCVPLFMLMAEILRVSGLSSRIYSRPCQARRPASRRIAADQHRGLRDLRLGQRIEHRDRGVDRRRRAAATHRAANTTGDWRRGRWRPAARSASCCRRVSA